MKEARPELYGFRSKGGIKVGSTRISQFIASLPVFHFSQYASTGPCCTSSLTELEGHLFSVIHSTNIRWVSLMFQTLCWVLETQWRGWRKSSHSAYSSGGRKIRNKQGEQTMTNYDKNISKERASVVRA